MDFVEKSDVVTDSTNAVTAANDEWAVILAGGDGTRLKSLTRQIAGDERPKQFCSVMGGTTLLEETQRRVALEFARVRTLHVVNQAHENFYTPIVGNEAPDSIVTQPRNRGTTPAILYSLLRIVTVSSDALVAFFPSDHYISDDARFMAHIRTALETARRRRDLVILLGLEPESPEVEYGWIEPTARIPGNRRIFGVRRFWEKPNQFMTQVLMLRGCLWNSFVMVASARALQEMIESANPDLYRSFTVLTSCIHTAAEAVAVRHLYDRMNESNFSHQVLAHRPQCLAVLKVTGVRWNDLGEPKRVIASLNMAGIRPQWANTIMPQSV
jgi:mannose-1-phosphate guanylyltransferase